MAKHRCDCIYDTRLAAMFEECFELPADNFDDVNTALSHCPTFNNMVEAVTDEDCDPHCVMVDAVRLGFECGRRMTEITNLERMVGLGKKYGKRTRRG